MNTHSLMIDPDPLSQLVRVTFERIHQNNEECHTIPALRDTLLPKLISGELSVRKAELFMEVQG